MERQNLGETGQASQEPGINDDSRIGEPRLTTETGVALRVAHLTEPVLADLGYRLVRVRLLAQAGTTLQIMAERPDGSMTVADCETLSAAVSPLLDAEDLVKGSYHLEISSAGIDRPLVRVSDFCRALGKETRIELRDGIEGRKRFRGRIAKVEGEALTARVTLEDCDVKPGEPTAAALPLSDLAEAKLVLTQELIRQSLAAAKAQQAEEDADENSDAAQLGHAETTPRRGPGRFTRKTSGKPKPLLPAGIQAGLKRLNSRENRVPHRKGSRPGRGDKEDGSQRQ